MPFPFLEKPRLRPRPVLIVSNKPFGPDQDIYWAMMITSAANSDWPEDIFIGDNHAEMGLPVPCYVRPPKIAAISADKAQRRLGEASAEVKRKIREFLGRNLG